VLELYEILGTSTQPLDIAKLQAQPYYNCGLQAWHQKDFSKALDYFQKVVQQNPSDRVARLYLERCQARLGLMPQSSEVPWQGYAAS
jgi:two-component system sensor histidine kinase ChiS